ncbi:hypothetical protein V6N12_012897 [Hibiscus sabdariffa]|uniref:Secreted protein n=1 Tax=Hibiscus sabdariffa TaxID=183260 RepID=A0ABR2EFS5_9ROSI
MIGQRGFARPGLLSMVVLSTSCLDVGQQWETLNIGSAKRVVLGPGCDGEPINGEGAHHELMVVEIGATNNIGSRC